MLLLNTVLTVRQSNANSHRKSGWELFTTAVLRAVGASNEGVVFLLWGKHAIDKGACIDKVSDPCMYFKKEIRNFFLMFFCISPPSIYSENKVPQ